MDIILKLAQEVAESTEKTRFWLAEAKRFAATEGLTSDCYKRAQRLASMWSHDLETKQEELEILQDEEELEFNTEFAEVD